LKRARAEEQTKKDEERAADQARNEREKRIADATKSLPKNVDDVQGITFYEHKDVADDWLFIERYSSHLTVRSSATTAAERSGSGTTSRLDPKSSGS
jgi:phosphoenolpyruvate-protein kinase (PTS system EI component)